MRTRLVAVTLVASALFATDSAARSVVHAGELLAVPGQAPKSLQSLILEGGRIEAVEPGYLEPGDQDRLIDLSCCFVLPGLIDLHVHLTSPATGGRRLRAVTEDAAALALRAAEFGRLTVEAGFTTVLDLGTNRRAHEQAIYAYREATAAHRVPGPRILAVGSPLAPTGLARTGLFRDEVEAAIGPEGVCDGAVSCAGAVREQVKRGADVIAFYTSGSLLDEWIVPQTFTEAEMRAIVDTAHSLGRRVVADGHTAPGVNTALRAGADVIDTMPWPDEETWELFEETGAVFVPHLYAFEVSIRASDDGRHADPLAWLADPIRNRLLQIMQAPYSAELAHKRGVRIAFGSDPGVIEHGDNAGEFGELVKAGLSPMEAIEAATVNAAQALGLSDRIGRLEPGMAADLIAVDRSPLKDIETLRRVRFVMRDGVVYKSRLDRIE